MLRRERIVLCGGAPHPTGSSSRSLQLALHGPTANVRLRVQDISKRLVANIPDVLLDLLELATYVYAADSSIPQGGKTDAHLGAYWRRKLRFFIPVRCPELWSSAPVCSALLDALAFLSEDEYRFEFSSLDVRPPMQSYLELSGENLEGFAPDEVILFSGGLDSFAGA